MTHPNGPSQAGILEGTVSWEVSLWDYSVKRDRARLLLAQNSGGNPNSCKTPQLLRTAVAHTPRAQCSSQPFQCFKGDREVTEWSPQEPEWSQHFEIQTFLHGKIACPLAAEWEILFPHGVISLSRSTLNGLPSPASKSFLSELVLSTVPWFFPFSNAKRLFHTAYYAACLITACLIIITLAFCVSEIPFTSRKQKMSE